MAEKHILITGSDEFAVKERAVKLTKELAPADAMNFETVDAQADNIDMACRQLERVTESLLTLPFFGGAKLVYFKNCTFLSDTPVGRNEEVTERLAQLIEVLKKVSPKEAQLVMSAPGADRRKSFYKQFEKIGATESFDLPDIKGARGEAEWRREIEKTLREAGLKASPGVAERLAELLGNDRRALRNETEKLVLYAHPEGRVEEDDLKNIVSATRELIIWDFLDAVVAGDVSRSVQMSRQLLAQQESAIGILIMLAGQVRLAALGTHLAESGRLRLSRNGTFLNITMTPGTEDLLPVSKKGERPNEFRLAKITDKARRRPARRWFAALDVLYRANLQLVSSASGREDKILETAVIRVCRI